MTGPAQFASAHTLVWGEGLYGSIVLDGRAVAGPGWGLPPERRNLAMVFHSYMELKLSHLPCRGDAVNEFEGRVVQRTFLGELAEYAVIVRPTRGEEAS